jgi:ADP-ribose pyrophosphatase YjhB (NUDIX family)
MNQRKISALSAHRHQIRYCAHCGGSILRQPPPGDGRDRAVCPTCGAIHYENPKLVVGCIPTWEDKILLCRRAIEPRYGYWTLPAGFMENGESTSDGAARETIEEAGARVHDLKPFALIDVPYVHQVHMYFTAQLTDLNFTSGDESLETRLFAENEIPWDDLSFRTVVETLKHFFADRAHGSFSFHHDTLAYPPRP